MATYRKRNRRWQVQIRREDHPPLTKSFKSKSDAALWARATETSIDNGELIAVGSTTTKIVTLHDLLSRYLERITPKKRGAYFEELRINSLLKHSICLTKIKHVTPQRMAQYRDERLELVKGDTVRRELAIFSHAFNIAIREWGVSLVINPVSRIEKPKPAKGRERRVSEDELKSLLSGCSMSTNDYLSYAIRLALHTGMRRGELLSMRWEHLDLTENVLSIPVTKTGYSRTIPIGKAAKAVLSEMEEQEDGKIFGITPNALRLSWERLRKRAGLEDIRFHDLRHEAISRFFEMGLSLPEVALISGHREPRMLMRYTHLRAEDVAKKL